MADVSAHKVPVRHSSATEFRTLEQLAMEPLGILTINVLSATGIPPMDLNGKADPFVVLKLGVIQLRTPIIKKSLAPIWNHKFRGLIYKNQTKLNATLDLWDWDRLSNDFIGSCDLNLADFTNEGGKYELNKTHPITLPFTPAVKARKLKKIKGTSELLLDVTFSTKEELQEKFWGDLFSYFDSNGDQVLDLTEFSSLLVGLQSDFNVIDEMGEEELFHCIDENKDGSITSDELVHFLKKNEELAKRLWGNQTNFMWDSLVALQDGVSVGDMVMDKWKVTETRLSQGEANKKLQKQILVHVRETGKIEVELIPNYIRVAMKMMYSNGLGRATTEKVRKILSKMTERQGRTYNQPKSKQQIPKFIEFHGINEEEMMFPVEHYTNFNEFFYRKLKPSARPVCEPANNSILVSPADCRLHVFPMLEEAQSIWVKGTQFSLPSLLQNDALADEFASCSLVIARLAPQDYHRFHCPVSGVVGQFCLISGAYYTVNPIAINHKIDVYGKNKRLVTTIETEQFGKVVFVAVGATMVGSINMTAKEGKPIKKGDELGYFAFGGSTCLVLFKQGSLAFDTDLMVNSSKAMETLVKVGERLGNAVNTNH